MARNQLSSSAGMGAAPVMADLHLVEAEQLADAGEGHVVEELVGGDLLLGGACPSRWRRRWAWPPRPRSSNWAAFSGSAARAPIDAGVDLLPHAGHPEHELGLDLAGVGGDVARVRTAGRPRSRGTPAGSGWSSARRCGPSAGTTPGACRRSCRSRCSCLRLSTVQATLLVGDHHALGRAGGARRVDQRGQVVGLRSTAAASARSTGVGRQQVLVGEDVVGRPGRRGRRRTPRCSSAGSSSRTLRKRSRKPMSSTTPQVRLGSGRRGTRSARATTSCRWRSAWPRRSRRPCRGRGTRAMLRIMSTTRCPARPRGPAGRRPRAATRSAYSAKVHSPHAVVLVAATAGRPGRRGAPTVSHERGRDRLTLDHGLDVGARRHALRCPPRCRLACGADTLERDHRHEPIGCVRPRPVADGGRWRAGET